MSIFITLRNPPVSKETKNGLKTNENSLIFYNLLVSS